MIQPCQALLCLPPGLSYRWLLSRQEDQRVPWVQELQALLTQPLLAWQQGPLEWCPQGVQEVQGGQGGLPFPPYLVDLGFQGFQVCQLVPAFCLISKLKNSYILPLVPFLLAFRYLLVSQVTQGHQSLPEFLLDQQDLVCLDSQEAQLDPDDLLVLQVQADQFLPVFQQVPCGRAVQGVQSFL